MSNIEKIAAETGLSQAEIKRIASATFGSIGGKGGKGVSKRRSPKHYAEMVRIRKANAAGYAEIERIRKAHIASQNGN